MRIKEQIKYEEEESSSGSESGSSSEERRSEDDSKQKRLKEEKEKKGGRKKRKGKKKRGWNAGTTTRTTWTKAKSESEPESFGEEDEKQESAFLSKYHLKKVVDIEKRQRSARLQAEEDEYNRGPITPEEMEEERRRKRDGVKVLERPNLV